MSTQTGNKYIGVFCTAPIASKDEAIRKIAVDAVRNLAGQCSDPGAVEKLVVHFFGVLNGKLLHCCL